MYLEEGSTMSKKSYIQTAHVFAIPLSKLRHFGNPFANRLTESSYKSLTTKMEHPASLWDSTENLKLAA